MLIENIPADKIEYPNCPLCQSPKRSEALYRFSEFKVVKCKTCGLVYLYPRLTEKAVMKIYSKEQYFQGEGAGYSGYVAQEKSLRLTFRKLFETLSKNKVVGKSLLEIGCGYGFLLAEAEPWLPYRVGTDFSKESVKNAIKYADHVYLGGIDSIPESESFDLIICNQVIEHIYKPLDFLIQLKKHLNPGGVILLSTPWMNGPLYKLMRKKWPSFKIPEHVTYYDQRSLAYLMKKAGLSNIKKIPYNHAFPLSLIAEKLHISIGSNTTKMTVWVPYTTIAMLGNML